MADLKWVENCLDCFRWRAHTSSGQYVIYQGRGAYRTAFSGHLIGRVNVGSKTLAAAKRTCERHYKLTQVAASEANHG